MKLSWSFLIPAAVLMFAIAAQAQNVNQPSSFMRRCYPQCPDEIGLYSAMPADLQSKLQQVSMKPIQISCQEFHNMRAGGESLHVDVGLDLKNQSAAVVQWSATYFQPANQTTYELGMNYMFGNSNDPFLVHLYHLGSVLSVEIHDPTKKHQLIVVGAVAQDHSFTPVVLNTDGNENQLLIDSSFGNWTCALKMK